MVPLQYLDVVGTLECARQVKALNISAADKQKILTDIPLKLVGAA